MKTPLWEQYEMLEEQENLPRERRSKAARRPQVERIDADRDADEETKPAGPLAGFFADELIIGEPTVVKSGKEATVYCCQAHPRTGKQWLAAKVYRPRQQRNFKNDAVYMQGRTTLDARMDRAIRNGSKAGRAVQFGMWMSHEYSTLGTLYAAGADVPQPIASAGDALLIEYFGEPGHAAPQLINVSLRPEEAPELFQQMVHNLAILLDCDRVHGDLSPYNILYWKGRLRLIDFPQSVDPMDNPQAYPLFARDVENVCAYFRQYGLKGDPHWLARQLWIDSGRPHPKR